MTRVLVVLPHLGAGGAEQVVLTLMGAWSPNRLEAHLALVKRQGPFVDRVPPHVPVHDLGATRIRHAGPALLRLVRRLRPDVVFSSLSYLNSFLLLLRPAMPRRTRIVIREGTILSRVRPQWRLPAVRTRLLRALYGRADRIVCQCEFMKHDLEEAFGVPGERMIVIYNPVDGPRLRAAGDGSSDPFAGSAGSPRVVAVGRLSPEKGFDRLIDATPSLVRLRPEATVWILGEDPLPGAPVERALQDRVAALGVEDRVHLVGFQNNPAAWLRRADLFVLSSRFEGLPNALLEAMACGCPVVAVHNDGGTREIMSLTGQESRYVKGLDWPETWFRPAAGASDGPDLSAFDVARTAGAYESVLTGSS